MPIPFFNGISEVASLCCYVEYIEDGGVRLVRGEGEDLANNGLGTGL